MAHFKDLLTVPALHTFVQEAGFERPTAVQTASIPRLLSGKSVSVLAQTGSGKTLAYALPIVELLKKSEGEAPSDATPAGSPRAWIICPTRELGTQIEKVFKSIAHLAKFRVRHLKGGDSKRQTRAAVIGPIDVLIASPSRALKALNTGELQADTTRFVILDEADQLFDRGFFPDVKGFVSRLRLGDVQIGLFSATMPSTFEGLRADTFPKIDFDDLTLQGSHTLRDNIATDNYTVPFKDKLELSARLINKAKGPGFVFVNLKRTAESLFEQLAELLPGKDLHMLHGGLEKRDRRKVLANFADGGDLLVCTDVASRGLDLPGLNWVLNYDLPFEAVYYVHRCGRVGRTGQPAQVYNLVTTKDRELITRINTAIANQASLKLSRVVEDREPRARTSPKRGAKRVAGKPASKRAGERPSAAKRSGAQRTGERSSAAKRSGTQRAGERSSAAKRSGTQRAGERPSAAKRSGAQRAGERPSAAKRSGTQRAGERPSAAKRSSSSSARAKPSQRKGPSRPGGKRR